MAKLTTEQKQVLRETEKSFDKITRKFNFQMVRWAFRRKLDRESEKLRLEKEKRVAEARLAEINKKLT